MKANRKFVLDIKQNNNAMLFNLLIGAAMAIIIVFAIANVGTFINGTISDTLIQSYPTATSRTQQQNRTVNTLANISIGYDSTLDMLIVSAIIMAITLPLAAVVAIRKLF